MSANNPDDHRLDHVVVIMFENRSFDQLLGYLRPAAGGMSVEGVEGRNLSNPVSSEVSPGGPSSVAVHPAASMASPYPDPGEEFPHVNTQLFRTVAPASNRFASIGEMTEPFNAPTAPAPSPPPMNGFVDDYINAFKAQMDRLPTEAEYGQIMACYTPSQLPVLSGLANGFLCFDHWFCEVPSQTYSNRSFFHAGTSSGYVINGHPSGKFAVHNAARTIFNQLHDAGKSWRVYIDPMQFVSATALIHARALAEFFASNFGTIYDFFYDADHGQLPNYSFIEPNMFHPHTDMHPHSGARVAEDLHVPPPDTIIGGERLLAEVYRRVRAASSSGSNWENTALLITFDEHGGTFDHVPPPTAVRPDSSPGEEGFDFERLGVRVPTVLVSAWLDAGQVANSMFQHCSLIRTLRDWWSLGAPLTARDAAAPSFLPLLSRERPRAPESWPTVVPVPSGPLTELGRELLARIEDLDSPMEHLERDLLGDALAHEARVKNQPPVADSGRVSHRQAHQHFKRIASELFTGIVNGRQG